MVWRVAGYTTWWAPIGLYTLLAFSLFPLQPILKIKEESSFLWCLLCLDATALLFVLHCSKEHKRSVDIEKKKKRSFCLVIWALLFSLCYPRRWRWLNIARSSSAAALPRFLTVRHGRLDDEWARGFRGTQNTSDAGINYLFSLLLLPFFFYFFST